MRLFATYLTTSLPGFLVVTVDIICIKIIIHQKNTQQYL